MSRRPIAVLGGCVSRLREAARDYIHVAEAALVELATLGSRLARQRETGCDLRRRELRGQCGC